MIRRIFWTSVVVMLGASGAQAEVKAELVVSEAEVSPGDSFTIGVDWQGGTPIGGADYSLILNTNHLTLTDAAFAETLSFSDTIPSNLPAAIDEKASGLNDQRPDIFVTWAILGEDAADGLLGQDIWLNIEVTGVEPGDTIRVQLEIDRVLDIESQALEVESSSVAIRVVE